MVGINTPARNSPSSCSCHLTLKLELAPAVHACLPSLPTLTARKCGEERTQ
jgi:hypothetical protein